MSIFNFNKFFKNKETNKVNVNKLILTDEEKFNVEKFNDWFCNEYSEYDGRQDAKGIFKRTDKLSHSIINDWFEYLNTNYTFNDTIKMNYIVRLNWKIIIRRLKNK